MPSSFALSAVPVTSAVTQLQARRLSSQTASCSYVPISRDRKRPRECTACRAAQTEVADEADAPEELSDDLMNLLGPRTVPTPVLSPQEVSGCTCVCAITTLD